MLPCLSWGDAFSCILMEPLNKLAEKPGIAPFAIDEVHCVSKWGLNFFDLTVGLLLCLISSVKGASYCLPLFFISILIFTYNGVRFISFCAQEPTCACYFLTTSYNSLVFINN
jgi:hypothetical protein